MKPLERVVFDQRYVILVQISTKNKDTQHKEKVRVCKLGVRADGGRAAESVERRRDLAALPHTQPYTDR